MRFSLILFLIFVTLLSKAQYGPGEKNLFSQEFSWGLFIPAFKHDNQIRVWGSNDFVYGLNYRAKVAPFLGLGGNFNARFFQYKVRQSPEKFYPDSTLWDRQRLSVSALQFTFFARLYLTPKDDQEGVYLDLGVSSDMMVYRENFFLDKSAASGAKRTRERGLQYMNFASYGFMAKVNFNYFGVFATYRMSNLFKEYQGTRYGEFPRFSVGLVVRSPIKPESH